MFSSPVLKELIMTAIIISFLATFLNQHGLLQITFVASNGIVRNIGDIIGLVFAVIAIRLALMVPEKQPA